MLHISHIMGNSYFNANLCFEITYYLLHISNFKANFYEVIMDAFKLDFFKSRSNLKFTILFYLK